MGTGGDLEPGRGPERVLGDHVFGSACVRASRGREVPLFPGFLSDLGVQGMGLVFEKEFGRVLSFIRYTLFVIFYCKFPFPFSLIIL